MKKPSLLRRFAGGLWRAITWLRLALANVLFLVLLVALYFLFSGGPTRELPEKAALLLNPAGSVVDERSRVEPLALLGQESAMAGEVRLRDMIAAVDGAASDPRISALVLQTDQLAYLGLSRGLELAPALARFRATGKPVIAVADYYTQDQYFLAVQADTVLMHSYGVVALEGFASYPMYFRDALDKLSINMHVFRAGEFKSVAEPLTRMSMSDGEKAITQAWLDDLWQLYSATVETRRGLAGGSLQAQINDYPERLAAAGGDSAVLALESGLVDSLMSRTEMNAYLAKAVGAQDDDGRYKAVPFDAYLAHTRSSAAGNVESAGQRVAVVSASGNMLPGDQEPGAIGGDSLARQLREVAAEPDVAAIVLRLDTGGGSVFASEVIRVAIAEIRSEYGMPVVVSMSRAAASGGYFVATAADQIWATPATITGSIGVFAAFPTFEDLFARAGVATDGVGTTEFAGAFRIDRSLDAGIAASLQLGVDDVYRKFVRLVAEGRNMTIEQVDAVAQGRVWSGSAAVELGLVDELGGLAEAAAGAASLAGLKDGEYRVDYIDPAMSPRQMLLQVVAENMATVSQAGPLNQTLAAGQRWLAPLKRAGVAVSAFQDPRHLYMRCMACEI